MAIARGIDAIAWRREPRFHGRLNRLLEVFVLFGGGRIVCWQSAYCLLADVRVSSAVRQG